MGPTKTQVLEKLEKLPNSTLEADLILKDVTHCMYSNLGFIGRILQS